ncbi:hypothetical protein GCM10023231_32940 [Olivibacter ginsenosidimutans]|uniref:Glycoside hydrolase family 127 protein n=1 Tax=Olivibacter ginsenosidimutans TaxID=1176537 RepID=A0ABP9BWL0_9SPHI
MRKSTGSIILFFAFLHVYTQAQELRNKAVADQFLPAQQAVLNGYIGKKLDQSYENRILAQSVSSLIEPFHHRTENHLWQSEFWGKWFTSAVLAYRYRPEDRLKEVLKKAVDSLIATQTADGYIGNYAPTSHLQEWDIWGRKYTLLGLLDYHALMGDKKSLQAAKKLADHLIQEIEAADGLIVNKGNYRGMAASSILEPMVLLYRATGDPKYLDFSKTIVQQWESLQGPKLISKATIDVSKRFPTPKNWYSYEQGQKAYEMMSCYEGLLELYRVTGNEQYKQAVIQTWQNIKDTEINIAGSGASEEMWFGGEALQTSPVTHYQETCVTVTWIKLNQQLLRLTGEAKYADEIERAYYNALLGSLNQDGSDWAKYTPLNGQRLPGSGQCGMDINCCVANGPRGQFTLPFTAVMAMSDGLSVNFYTEGAYKIRSPHGKTITLIQKTSYPVSDKINLTLAMPSSEEMTIQVRIPYWSDESKVWINDEEIPVKQSGEFLKIHRKWSSEDRITLALDLRGKVVIQQRNQRKFAAITRGPIVLARDSRFGGPDLITVNTPVLSDKDQHITLHPINNTTSDNTWMLYQASFLPESYTEKGASPIDFTLCDYASAGNGKIASTFAVWLAQLYSGREH